MMTLKNWTTTPSAVAAAVELQSTETYKQMLEVLMEEMPLSRVPLPFGSCATDYAYAHGMQKGYEYALKVLRALGQHAAQLPREPESTFSASNYNNTESDEL